MSLNYRPLGHVMEILESVGLPVSYSYDDLVFVENNSLLVKFNDDDEKELMLYFNKDLDPKVAVELESTLMEAALDKGFQFVNSGTYKVREKDKAKEELELVFLN
ncbi:hypothetical protein [Plebeiibacterium marinum]|uniref:Uncharacterized protein n=1 Tax=Plebeiibacterium marinum TaxID=2992111 RepID=A0AAE3SL27_9BACT|nr:hypothetical protein [Plebeiobacterium marinum]MCW3807158.1 hypothetical protein [Plebeiobacterium marinum]